MDGHILQSPKRHVFTVANAENAQTSVQHYCERAKKMIDLYTSGSECDPTE